jgi:hypothetical protein
VGRFQVNQDKSQSETRKYIAEVSAELSFAIDRSAFLHNNGDCWHNLFRNCLVVEGYPISRRPEIGTASGLEIPFPMMAGLAQAKYVNTFLGRPIVKGFSTMLVPTENHDEIIVWHLVHNKNGDRMSYLDCTVVPAEALIAGQFSQRRHILGWCSDIKYLAGMFS